MAHPNTTEETADYNKEEDGRRNAGRCPDLKKKVVRIGHFFTSLRQLVLSVRKLVVAGPTTENRMVGHHPQGRLPVLQAVSERFARFRCHLTVQAAGNQGNPETNDQDNAGGNRPLPRYAPSATTVPRSHPEQHESDGRSHVGAAALGQHQAHSHRYGAQKGEKHRPAAPDPQQHRAKQHKKPRRQIPGQGVGQREGGKRLCALQTVFKSLRLRCARLEAPVCLAQCGCRIGGIGRPLRRHLHRVFIQPVTCQTDGQRDHDRHDRPALALGSDKLPSQQEAQPHAPAIPRSCSRQGVGCL